MQTYLIATVQGEAAPSLLIVVEHDDQHGASEVQDALIAAARRYAQTDEGRANCNEIEWDFNWGDLSLIDVRPFIPAWITDVKFTSYGAEASLVAVNHDQVLVEYDEYTCAECGHHGRFASGQRTLRCDGCRRLLGLWPVQDGTRSGTKID